MAFHRRRGGFGNNGSIRLHKASSIRRSDMRDHLAFGHATVPISPVEYKSTEVKSRYLHDAIARIKNSR